MRIWWIIADIFGGNGRLGMPTLDRVRELKKYDIGAIFAIDTPRRDEAIDLMWKYVIDICLKDGAVIGNAAAEV